MFRSKPGTLRGVVSPRRYLSSKRALALVVLTGAICVAMARSRSVLHGTEDGICLVPLAYDAPTDRLPRLLPPLPALGPAGCRITDPTFHTSIVRVTD